MRPGSLRGIYFHTCIYRRVGLWTEEERCVKRNVYCLATLGALGTKEGRSDMDAALGILYLFPKERQLPTANQVALGQHRLADG